MAALSSNNSNNNELKRSLNLCESISIVQVRKIMQEVRTAYNKNTASAVFFPSNPVTSVVFDDGHCISMETFALSQVIENHKKRHSKSKNSR